jgi:hypothetical protein
MSKDPSTARLPERIEQMIALQADWERRARDASATGGLAFERLLSLVEAGGDSGQTSRIAGFVAATVGFHHFDIYDLRALDVDLSDDVLACLDAVRWGKCHLAELVPNGFARARQVSEHWGYVAKARAQP